METAGARLVLQILGCPPDNGANGAATARAMLGMKPQARDAPHVLRASTVTRLACPVTTVPRGPMRTKAEPAPVWNAGSAPIRTHLVPPSAPHAEMLLPISHRLPARRARAPAFVKGDIMHIAATKLTCASTRSIFWKTTRRSI